MKKEKVIELIKLAAHKHKQGKYPETLKLLYPIYGKVKIEKIEKLYKSARIKTIQQLKTMLSSGSYTEIQALIDSYLKNINDTEIQNIAMLVQRNLNSQVVAKMNKNSEKNTIPDTQEQKNTKENTSNTEFSIEDLNTENTESDFLIDSSDFESKDEHINLPENKKETKDNSQIDVSRLEHTPAEMLGETDIFFSENPFIGDENTPTEEESFDLELETGFVKQAEGTESENDGDDVNYLIKQGVSLYEIGDLENALKSWKKALSIDKSNPILKEYIENCKNELGIEDSTKKQKEEPIGEKKETPKAVNATDNVISFSKNEINRIIAIARTGEIDRAKQLLSKFEQNNENRQEIKEAKFYINKLEEEFFVEKTLAKAEEFIENKQSEKAIKILKSLLDKFPENEKADELLELAKKRAEFDLIHSTEQTIELQLDIQQPKPQNTYKPSSVHSVKPTKSVKQTKRKNISPKSMLVILVFFVIAIGLVAGYKFFNSKKNAKIVFNSIMSKITDTKQKHLAELPKANSLEDMKSKQFETVTKQARRMYNNGNYLFAYYLYIQAEGYGKLNDNDYSYLQATKERINIKINAKKILKKAERKFKRQKFEDAIGDYYQLLSTNPDNIKFKKRLYECYLNTGIKYGLNGNCKASKQFFEYALILDPSNPYLPKHLQTIDRCISGIISKNQVKSWFIFFR